MGIARVKNEIHATLKNGKVLREKNRINVSLQ